VNILRLDNTDGGGGSSQIYLDNLDNLKGDLEAGEISDGQMLFDAVESESYYISVNSGLISSGAVMNEVTWNFDKSEAE